MKSVDIEKALKALKPVLSSNYYVDQIGYFGSFARNEQTEDSDVDILVSLRKPLGWSFFDLQNLLENTLQRKVDLVSIRAIKEQFRDQILGEVKYV